MGNQLDNRENKHQPKFWESCLYFTGTAITQSITKDTPSFTKLI